MKTRKSLLFLFAYQPRSTTMPATASEMMKNVFSGPSIAQGQGKSYKKPEIHDENIVLVAKRPVKEMRKLKLFR